MNRRSFVEHYGGIYEHSPWVAERAWDSGACCDTLPPPMLARVLAAVVDAAGSDEQLALIRAHPDLAGRAALAGSLTDASAAEQASAGLDRCSEEEFNDIQILNSEYSSKFNFPFVIRRTGFVGS